MCSVKLKFRPSAVEGREGTIYYQVTHNRRVRLLATDYHIFQTEWDEKKKVVTFAGAFNVRAAIIRSVRDRVAADIARISKIIRRLDAGGIAYETDDIVAEFLRYTREYSLFNYFNAAIARLKRNGKLSTADNYKSTLNNFKKFLTGRASCDNGSNCHDMMIDNLNSGIMEDYEAWLHRRGITPNTSSFYIRILRAVYNRAVDEGIIENQNPFRRVYTGVDKTIKRAIPIEAIKRLRMLDLIASPRLDYARDMFLMSFYLRGMSFIDMAYLRKTDLNGGYVTYRRRKTNQLLTIRWTREMQEIIDKHKENPTDFLLPIIKDSSGNLRSTYKNKLHAINRDLKRIALSIDIATPLTMYVARHSWASAAKTEGIPTSVISEGMGHDSEATTRIYLASLQTSVVDNANSQILKSLNNCSN